MFKLPQHIQERINKARAEENARRAVFTGLNDTEPE